MCVPVVVYISLCVVPLIEKSRTSCPGGRFPPSFIPQVIIITGLSKFTIVCSRSEDGLRC